MTMISLTCRNHPYLRWRTKYISWTPGRGFTHQRNLFFTGDKHGEFAEECSCPTEDLVLAPEEKFFEEQP